MFVVEICICPYTLTYPFRMSIGSHEYGRLVQVPRGWREWRTRVTWSILAHSIVSRDHHEWHGLYSPSFSSVGRLSRGKWSILAGFVMFRDTVTSNMVYTRLVHPVPKNSREVNDVYACHESNEKCSLIQPIHLLSRKQLVQTWRKWWRSIQWQENFITEITVLTGSVEYQENIITGMTVLASSPSYAQRRPWLEWT